MLSKDEEIIDSCKQNLKLFITLTSVNHQSFLLIETDSNFP
jgi:hypothetical protein